MQHGLTYAGQMEERMTLCNMVIEAGGKNGIVPADSTTYKYLEVSTVNHQIISLDIYVY